TSEYLSQLSDVLAAFQRMSDRRRLGIKNEAEGYGLIPLTQGKFAIVDVEDYDWLIQYKWHACKCKNTFYAGRVEGGKTIRMHREIMRAPKGLVCDHINHNGLDNRKSNLRLCTNAQNCYNQRASASGTSKYKGVSWHKCSSKWSARIRCDGKFYNLGDFDDQMEAAMVYDDKAVELFDEFACLNFPERIEFRKWLKRLYGQREWTNR
ncbi:MAG: HNH endonuclease, partial [Planctomycetota bacterium]